MLTSTPAYKGALHGPHRRETSIRVSVLGETLEIIDTEALITGNVTAQLTNRVTRTCEFSLPGRYFPRLPTDLLSPYQAVVQISTGIGFPDGSREIFPVFTGRIYQATLGADGVAVFRGDDLAADVVAYRFEVPTSSQSGPGTSTIAEIRRLIRQAVPGATFGTDTADDANVPILAWDEDRGQALDDLAASLRSRWYALGDGSFVVRKFPYVAETSVADIVDGPGGLLSNADINVTRDAVTNSVTVVSERLDGSEPVRATVRDNNSSSPTYFGDRFGRVSQIVTIQTPVDSFVAELLARKQLVSSLSLSEQWTGDMVPDASLEPGDTVSLSYRGVNGKQVLDNITYPLTTEGTMRIQGRSSIAEPVLTDINATAEYGVGS